MGFEANTKVFINTKSGSYFNSTSDQSITLLNNFAAVTQVKSIDIYNTGGKALMYSVRGGGGAINERDWGLIRLNAVIQDIAPAPPIVKASIYHISGFNRPKIQILSNRGTLDFQKYEIYKSKANNNWQPVYCGETYGNEFIDYNEFVLANGFGDTPPPNCVYTVNTIDQTNKKSVDSNPLSYRVGEYFCPNCAEGLGDNQTSNSEPIIEAEILKPKEYLLTNFPNPFNPSTKIYYNIPKEGIVKITIYNSLGQTVKELVNEFKYIGNYVAEFNGSDLSSGVYIYKLSTGNFSETKRMMLIK